MHPVNIDAFKYVYTSTVTTFMWNTCVKFTVRFIYTVNNSNFELTCRITGRHIFNNLSQIVYSIENQGNY